MEPLLLLIWRGGYGEFPCSGAHGTDSHGGNMRNIYFSFGIDNREGLCMTGVLLMYVGRHAKVRVVSTQRCTPWDRFTIFFSFAITTSRDLREWNEPSHTSWGQWMGVCCSAICLVIYTFPRGLLPLQDLDRERCAVCSSCRRKVVIS